jgi:hypothetical protein
MPKADMKLCSGLQYSVLKKISLKKCNEMKYYGEKKVKISDVTKCGVLCLLRKVKINKNK